MTFLFVPILIITFWLFIAHDPSFSMLWIQHFSLHSLLVSITCSFNMQDIAFRHSLQLNHTLLHSHSFTEFCHTLARHIFRFNEPRLFGRRLRDVISSSIHIMY